MRRRLRGMSVRRRKQARDFVVTVNGEPQKRVTAFDTREGWVRRFALPLRAKGNSLAVETVRGRVRVERVP